VKGAYDLLVSMALIAYFIPYLFVFASMIRLQSRPAMPGALRLPGGKRVVIPLACVGFSQHSQRSSFPCFLRRMNGILKRL